MTQWANDGERGCTKEESDGRRKRPNNDKAERCLVRTRTGGANEGTGMEMTVRRTGLGVPRAGWNGAEAPNGGEKRTTTEPVGEGILRDKTSGKGNQED